MRRVSREEAHGLLRTRSRAKSDRVLVERVADAGGLLHGHFLQQAGAHSEFFLRYAAVGRDADLNRRIAEVLCATDEMKGAKDKDATVLCPESAGFYLGSAIAQAQDWSLAVAAIDLGRRPGRTLRRGALAPGGLVVIVNDVATTGGGLLALLDLAHRAHAKVVGVAVAAAAEPTALVKAMKARGLWTAWAFKTLWPHAPAGEGCAACDAGEPLLPAAEFN